MSADRFVILFHELPEEAEREDHWDFMLQDGDVLRTWALPEEPADAVIQICEQLPDHRLAYLDYEGPISGNRGNVTRWDRGIYDPKVSRPQHLSVTLWGQRLEGVVELSLTDGQWTFCFHGSCAEKR